MNCDAVLAVFNEKERQFIEANNLYAARLLAVHRLREEGLSLRRIGYALGLSHERVRQLLQDAPSG